MAMRGGRSRSPVGLGGRGPPWHGRTGSRAPVQISAAASRPGLACATTTTIDGPVARMTRSRSGVRPRSHRHHAGGARATTRRPSAGSCRAHPRAHLPARDVTCAPITGRRCARALAPAATRCRRCRLRTQGRTRGSNGHGPPVRRARSGAWPGADRLARGAAVEQRGSVVAQRGRRRGLTERRLGARR